MVMHLAADVGGGEHFAPLEGLQVEDGDGGLVPALRDRHPLLDRRHRHAVDGAAVWGAYTDDNTSEMYSMVLECVSRLAVGVLRHDLLHCCEHQLFSLQILYQSMPLIQVS